jgi:hippurate hydrolase
MAINALIQDQLPEITAWRHDIHGNPELDFDVQRTASFVADKLRGFGADEVIEGVGRTGVVGIICGTRNTSGKVIGLRADMDALPIVEATDLPYASKTHGRMHACGHDGHTAMLLGAARVLADERNFNGSVAVIFQPAEEGGGGGREMVEDGMMERFGIEQVFGMHNIPGMPIGEYAMRSGAIMACADQFTIEVEGRGGHAAMPNKCIDTNLVAAQIIIALQSIASRFIDPMQPVVVSVTSIQSGSNAFNIIPQTVQLKGTVRALDSTTRELAQGLVSQIAAHTAQTYGAAATIDYEVGYPATVNSVAETQFAAGVAQAVVSEEKVNTNVPPLMAGEDFSFMLNARPGAFIFLGNGNSAFLHHPKYDFNDAALVYGCSYWISLVEQGLPLSGSSLLAT